MKLNQFDISSRFLCATQLDHAIVPKFAIIVNGESFEYHQSAQYLTTMYKQMLKRNHYSSHSGDWVIGDGLRANSPFMVEGGEVLVRHTNRQRYRVQAKYIPTFLNKLNKMPYKLSTEDELFAFRCVLSDSLFPVQMSEEEFVTDLGYAGDYQSVQKGIRIYNQCRDIYFKLRLGEQEIIDLLDELSEQGIE